LVLNAAVQQEYSSYFIVRKMEIIDGFARFCIDMSKKEAVSKLTTEFREELHKLSFVHRNILKQY